MKTTELVHDMHTKLGDLLGVMAQNTGDQEDVVLKVSKKVYDQLVYNDHHVDAFVTCFGVVRIERKEE